MGSSSEFKKKSRTILRVILGLVLAFVLLGIIAVVSGPDEPAVITPKPAQIYLSARDLKIKLEKDGYEFQSPYDLDSMERLTWIEASKERLIHIFYRDDTVLNAVIHLRITDDRDNTNLIHKKVSDFTRLMDNGADEWVKMSVSKHGTKSDLEIDTTINGRYYAMAYFSEVEKDIFRFEVYKSKPE